MTATEPPCIWTGPPPARRDYQVSADTRQGGQGVLFVATLRSDRLGPGMSGTPVGLKQLTGLAPGRWAKISDRSPRLAKLDHPGLVRHLETFRGPAPCASAPPDDECDLCYSAHVWVEGDTLSDRAGQASPDTVFSWIRQLAQTLDFLHHLPDGPIAHRDLHPGNVVITPTGGAVVIDYETALPFDDAAIGTNMLMGRIGFIPPERSSDSSAPADAGDRWQLGMLAVYSLLGFPQGAMMPNQLVKHLEERLAGQVPDVDRTVATLMSMLAPRPLDRPESCTAWAESLAQHAPLRPPTTRRMRKRTQDGEIAQETPPLLVETRSAATRPRRRLKRPERSLRMIGLVVPVVGLALWWAMGDSPPSDPGARDPSATVANRSSPTTLATRVDLTPLGSVGSTPAVITTGPDGTLWFTEQAGDSIWKLTPGGEPIRMLLLQPGSHPFGIATDAGGNVWFTEGEADGSSGDAVGKLDPDGNLLHLTSLPEGSQPTGIVAGPDGHMWVTAYGTESVYRIEPDGGVSGGPFEVGGNPNRIVVGPDRNLWVTIASGSKVVVLSSQGAVVKDYNVVAGPTDIVVATGNNVWITSHNSNSLQRISATTGEVSAPYRVAGGPGALVVGHDGNLWFTQLSGHAVSVLSPAGALVRTVSLPGGTPFGITKGSDDAVWFTVQGSDEANPDAIGRIEVDASGGGSS